MTILEILDYFRSGLHSIDSLSESDQQVLRDSLQTSETFTPQQRALLSNWRLLVPEDRLEEIQLLSKLNSVNQFEIVQHDGQWLINADLLTDTHYEYAFPVLRSLNLIEVVIEPTNVSMPL